MALQIGLQILLPAFLLIGLWRGAFKSRLEWLLNALAVSAVCLFVFLTARWDFTSYYIRVLLPLLIAAAAYSSYRRANGSHGGRRKLKLSVAALTNAALLVVFSGLSLFALSGYGAPEEAIQLSYPLRDGTYYVGGGNSRFVNNHQAHDPQKFALDIVRLNLLGSRAWGLAPDEPERYEMGFVRKICG